MSYKVRLPIFEGPFDLLVYLVEDAQMSIYDIRISEITTQYISYIQSMRDLNIEVSSEFLVLAAELTRIKSRMMLPHPAKEAPDAPVEDPRNELVGRLIAYKRCKKGAEILSGQQERMENIFAKPKEDISIYTDHPDEVLSLSLKEFSKAFRQFLHRQSRIQETVRRYTILERERQTMERKMETIRGRVQRSAAAGEQTLTFGDFVEDPTSKRDVITSFLSILQLAREQYLVVDQNALYGEIEVRQGKRSFDDFDARRAAEEIS